ncbi:MAG TPA: DNA polymerase III subunit delta [Chthoniobacterales bacterium]
MPSKKTSGTLAAPRTFAVLGSDDAQVKARARSLAAELTPPGAGDFGVDVVDGAADHAEQAVSRLAETIQAIQTVPFFGGEKLVWLRNITFLADTATGRSNGVLAALEEFREILTRGLPPGVRLLLSAVDVDKRRSFYKALGKFAQVEVYDKVDTSKAGWEEDAQAMTMQWAARAGLHFEPEALELFTRLAGADSRQVQNELEKLDLYLGPEQREVTLPVVRAMVSKSTTGVIWELSTSILKRDLAESLELLNQLLFQGETAVGILLAAVIPTVRNLVAVKELLERHRVRPPAAPYQFTSVVSRLPPEATEHLPRKKDGSINAYALGLAACQAHRFTMQEAITGLEACLEANLQLVTSQLEPRLVLSRLLVALLTPGVGRKADQIISR